MGDICYAPLIDDMTWSYSRVKSFEDCPYKWFLKYIVGLHGILTSHLNESQMKILAALGCRVVFALDKDVSIREDRHIARLSFRARHSEPCRIYRKHTTITLRLSASIYIHQLRHLHIS